ncbi:MAG TPA: TIGR00645 family protein [Caldimonas sp.]|nr:TIGR00645 family protein [Caldimonas sp.]
MSRLRPLPNFIFMTRWLQLPLYLGLILAQCVYVYHFWLELVHLLSAAMGSSTALEALVGGIGYELGPTAAATASGPKLTETVIMLAVLGLIDVVMISNLLIMVIVGGYETFVSRMGLEGHPDEPEWLSHVNASVLKVKLATAIIGISSIHLLKTFISAGGPSMTVQTMMWQTIIHITFLVSAIAIAYTDRLLNTTPIGTHRRHPPEEGV